MRLSTVLGIVMITIFSYPLFANNLVVGSKSNRSFPSLHGGFIATWDGRVVIFPSHIKDSLYKWDTYALRYESIKTNHLGEPDLMDQKIFSPLVTLDGDFGFDSLKNKLNAQNRMHLAIAPDPAFTLNPYPSDSKGKQTNDLASPFKTYRLFIIGTVGSLKNYVPQRSIPAMLAQSTAEIIVKNIGTDSAEVVSAKILAEGLPVRNGQNTEPFFGFEPTLSNDGRLVLWGGHPINGGIHFIMYSFNPTPKNNLTWSKPRHLTEMYWAHGAGALTEPIIDGVKFSDRYPIAKKQLRDAYGNIFAADDGYPGAYPWLSLDNGDLFCSTVSTFFAARRAGFSVIGSLTNYASRHIDGAINIARANVTGRADVWESTSEGKSLSEKYNALTDENGKLYGFNAFQRIMISPLLQIPSMWTPFVDTDDKQVLPFTNKKNTFGLLMSHSNRYVEVSLPEAADNNFVLSLPMNEAIRFNRKYLHIIAKHQDIKDWDDSYNVATYDPESTPDVSGLFQTGKLSNGAEFPFEYHEAVKKWKSERVLTDRSIGIEGNSIYFKPKSSITIATNPESLDRIKQSKELNISFFLRNYQSLKGESVFLWDKFLFLQLNDNDFTVKNYKDNNWKTILQTPIVITKNKWHHFSVNLSLKNIAFYMDGIKIVSMTTEPVTPAASKHIWLGPFTSKSTSTSALYSLDQVSISRVQRTTKEIQDFALINNSIVQKKFDEVNEAQVRLGNKLFHDPILSKDKSISCATCHVPSNHFMDGKAVAIGIDGKLGTRNTPSLFNLKKISHFMWDGKVDSLEAQALLPIENSNEMNLPLAEAIDRLKEKYLEDFKEAFNQEPNTENLGLALKAFQLSIVAPETSIDSGVLTEEQIAGRGLFIGKARCISCHMGPNLSDQVFHNVGAKPKSLLTDYGRELITRRESDRFKFRTPSLRFINKTAPYFHDGRFSTLEEIIDFYNDGGDIRDSQNELQPLGLNQQEKIALIKFLESL